MDLSQYRVLEDDDADVIIRFLEKSLLTPRMRKLIYIFFCLWFTIICDMLGVPAS